jgi:hypothetical protein
MKKVITFLCICCLIFSSLPSAHAVPRVKSTATPEPQQTPVPKSSSSAKKDKPIGEIGIVMGTLAVYNNHWDKVIGPSFGEDLSFDEEDYRVLDNNFWDAPDDSIRFLWDMDGYIVKADLELNIYAIAVNISDVSKSTLWQLSRVCALISLKAYDLPKSNAEAKNRFLTLSDEYVDFCDENLDQILKYGEALWVYQSEKGAYTFYFLSDENDDIYFSTSRDILSL